MLKTVSKSLKNVRLEMWFNGENESFNLRFIYSDTLVKRMSVSVQKYIIMLFSHLISLMCSVFSEMS